MQGCEHHRNKIDGRVRFIFLQNASPMMTARVIPTIHDGSTGPQADSGVYSRDDPCGHHALQKNEPHPRMPPP